MLVDTDTQAADVRVAGRRALRAAFVGYFVDMFDVYLPVLALGPAMIYFEPATVSPALTSTLYYVVAALSLIGRAFGAAIFGHYGDLLGRRRVTIVSMAGFATVTLIIGLLPGYEQLGLASILLLTALRLIDGVFLGGEYTGANPLAMEYAPKHARGLWAAVIHTAFPVSMTFMSLVTTGLLRILPSNGPHSAYVVWGWRIPFFIGALLAAGVTLYYVRRVPESRVWARGPKPASPLRALFQRDNARVLAQVFLTMTGIWFTTNAVTLILPGILLNVRHVDGLTVTHAQVVTYLVLTCAFITAGLLGQRFGRRRVLIAYGIVGCTIGPLLYYLLVASGYRNVAELTALTAAINVCALPVWGVVTAYLNERFNTGVRASGYGIGYSAATVIPAMSAGYMLALAHFGVPYEYTPLVIFGFGGLLLLIGALLGPETKDVEIA